MLRTKIAAGLVLAGSLLAATQTTVHAYTAQQVDKGVTVTGAGATFPLNMINQWKADFKKSTGATIEYTGVGSGAGRTQLLNKTVDFAGTDVLAPAAQINTLKGKYWGGSTYVPETGGAIAIVYKVKGVPGGIKLTGKEISRIFSGQVRFWDDKELTENNPNIDFPHTPVQVYVRSDSSGTSGNFTNYLTGVADTDWTYGYREAFPTDHQQIGKSGNDGVAGGVAASDGGIGYVETSFAKSRNLAMAFVKNGAGTFEYADVNGATKAINAAKFNADGTVTFDYNTTAAGVYPISAVTYFLVPLKWGDAKKLNNFKAFMDFILSDAQQKRAPKLEYTTLPPKLIAAAKANLAKVSKK